MTLTAISGSLIFNFTTNGNGQLLTERFRGIVEDPATLGALLAVVFTIASFTQLIVGKLIDRFPLKRLLPIVALQVPLFLLAAHAAGLGALRGRDRLHGLRLRRDPVHRRDHRPLCRRPDALARHRHAARRLLRRRSLAIWLLGPAVKSAGFGTMLAAMAAIALVSAAAVTLLPRQK